MTTEKDASKARHADSDAIKKKIVEAASQLFEKKGLYDTSVAEVAQAAGISAPVTYHYLTRKSDIMLLIMEHFTNQFINCVIPEIENLSNPLEKLKRAMAIYFQLFNENMVKVVLVYRESRTLDKAGRKKIMAAEIEQVKIIEDIIKEGIDQGVFKKVDADLAAYNIIMAGHTWALKSWHYHKKFTLDQYLALQTQFFIDALSA
jgi:AcrR family transcriptional regulator